MLVLVVAVIDVGAVSEVTLIGVLTVVIVSLGIVSAGEVVSLSLPCIHSILVSSVVPVFHLAHKRSLVIKILAFLTVLVIGHLVQFRNHIIQLLQTLLISLLTNSLCIGVAVSSGHSLCLTHGIHHCHLALLDILVLVLLVQGVTIQVIGELLPVQDLVDSIVELGLPSGLVFSRLLCELLIQKCLRLCYRVTGFVFSVFKASGFGLRGRCRRLCGSRLCGGRSRGGRGCLRFGQCAPCVVANDAVHIQIILRLVVLDRRLSLGTEDAVRVQLIAILIEQLLKLSYIAALGTVTDLFVISHSMSSYYHVQTIWTCFHGVHPIPT